MQVEEVSRGKPESREDTHHLCFTGFLLKKQLGFSDRPHPTN